MGDSIDFFDILATNALKLLCELRVERYQVLPRRLPMGPVPSSPRPVYTMVDEHLSVYLDVLNRHRNKPFIRLTAYGALEFLTAVTSDGVLRFERDRQPLDIFSFSSNQNGV